jgi:hypothetical protein
MNVVVDKRRPIERRCRVVSRHSRESGNPWPMIG